MKSINSQIEKQINKSNGINPKKLFKF